LDYPHSAYVYISNEAVAQMKITIPMPDVSMWPIFMSEGFIVLALVIGWCYYYLLARYGTMRVE